MLGCNARDSTFSDAIIDVLCTAAPSRAERFGVPAARLRWYEAERHRGGSLSTRATKAFGTVLGICVDAYRTLSCGSGATTS